jgi:hypothetical protein
MPKYEINISQKHVLPVCLALGAAGFLFLSLEAASHVNAVIGLNSFMNVWLGTLSIVSLGGTIGLSIAAIINFCITFEEGA